MNLGNNYFDILTNRIGLDPYTRNVQSTTHAKNRTKTAGTSGTSGIGNYNSAYVSDTKVADGAVKVENAGRTLAYDEMYEEKNEDQLLRTVKNFVDGYNDVNSGARSSSSSMVKTRAGWMKEDTLYNISSLQKIGIGYNYRTGELSVDEEKFKKADKDAIKKMFTGAGSFGQVLRNDASLTSQAAVTASRYSMNTGLYGSYGRNGLSGLNGLSGGYGGYSSLLSSMFSKWF